MSFHDDARLAAATASLPENQGRLPAMVTVRDAAQWINTGAEAELAGRRLTLDQRLLLAEIAQQGRKSEPQNAFWSQAESLFVLTAVGGTPAGLKRSVECWSRAARCGYWNDHETEWLQRVVRNLDSDDSAPFAWHLALADSRRTSAFCQRALLHSRALLGRGKESLDLRVDTVRNGALMRDGARSVQGALAAVQMVNLAVLGSTKGSAFLGTPRANQVAKGKFFAEVVDPQVKREMVDKLATNDAWEAFVPVDAVPQASVSMYRGALLAAVLPGALLGAGAVGLAAWLLGLAFAAKPGLCGFLKPPWCTFLGVLAGLAAYLYSGLLFPAAWVFVAVSSFGLSPDRLRAGEARNLGVLFKGTQVALALAVGVAVTILLIELSEAGRLIGFAAAFPNLSSPSGALPLNLAWWGLSIVLATAPAWGFLYRFPSVKVLPGSLMSFGGSLALGAFCLAIVSTPVCMSLDKSLTEDLGQCLLNEPSHYISQAP